MAEVRFAGSHGYVLDAAEGVEGEGDGEKRGGGAEGEESAVGGVLGGSTSGEEQGGAEAMKTTMTAALIIANQNSKRPKL